VSWVATIKIDTTQTVSVRVIDISATGLGIVTDDSLPPSGTLDMVIQVPVPQRPGTLIPVPIEARLVHQVFSAGRNRAGLQIVRVDPMHVQLMTNR